MRSWKNVFSRPVVFSFVAVVAFTGFAGGRYTSRTSFCGTCHEMQTTHAGWAAGSHATAHCYACHADKGVLGTLKAKVQGVRELAIHFTRPVKMEEVEAHVADARCADCHDMNDRAAHGERRVHAHRKHREAGLACVSCHAGVGHSRKGFDGFGSKTCVPCHEAKMREKDANYIRKTPCSRTDESTTASQAATAA